MKNKTLIPWTIGIITLTYLFDPLSGKKRRADLKSGLVGKYHRFRRFLDKAARDVKNRSYGLLGEIRYRLIKGKDVSDEVLVQRVRSKLGRFTSHPHAIETRSDNKRIFLGGPILAHEIKGLVTTLKSVPGVDQVTNELEPHDEAGNLSSLQGGKPLRGGRLELAQENWAPSVRLTLGVVGALLSYDGLRRSNFNGSVEITCGGLLLARSIANVPIKQVLGFDRKQKGLLVEKTMTVPAPVDEVFSFFSHFSDYPHFMRNICEASDLGDGCWRLVTRGPAGLPVGWNAQVNIIDQNKVIAWKSNPASTFSNEGALKFEDLDGKKTRVHLRMSYSPTLGFLGNVVASLLGASPKKELEEDFLRVKSYFETHKPARDVAKPQGNITDVFKNKKAISPQRA